MLVLLETFQLETSEAKEGTERLIFLGPSFVAVNPIVSILRVISVREQTDRFTIIIS